MDATNHARSSSLSAPCQPAPRPSFAPFPAAFQDLEDSHLSSLAQSSVKPDSEGEGILEKNEDREENRQLKEKVGRLEEERNQLHAMLSEERIRYEKWKQETLLSQFQRRDVQPQVASVPDSLNQSSQLLTLQPPQWVHSASSVSFQSHDSPMREGVVMKIEKQERSIERILWKKIITQILAISVSPDRAEDAAVLIADLESDLKDSNPVSEALVRFHEKALKLFIDSSSKSLILPSLETMEDVEDWKKKCGFYIDLVEQQNATIAEMKKEGENTPQDSLQSAFLREREELLTRISTLNDELQTVKNRQNAHELTLDQKLQALDEGRKLISREKNALQDAYQRLNANFEAVSTAKNVIFAELEALRSRFGAENDEKRKIMEEMDTCRRDLEASKVKIAELEEELASAESPYSHLHSIGEQLGTQFTTVSDLFSYLTTNLQTRDPDQQHLIEAYEQMHDRLGGPIAVSPAPSFISAMLSFLLIRKKMIEEERELQGHTLHGLKTQLEAALSELDVKNKAFLSASLELNELKLSSKSRELDGELYKKRSEATEDDLKVLKKAHERHIELYKTELETTQKRLNSAEKIALEKGVEAEALKKGLDDLEGRIGTLLEENAALEHENSFLNYEREELQKSLLFSKLSKLPVGSSLRELNLTLTEIQQALKDQQTHEKDLESLISSLNFQLEDQQTRFEQVKEMHEMLLEDVRGRDWERVSSLRLRGQIEVMRSEKEKTTREVREVAQAMAKLTMENEELVRLIASREDALANADFQREEAQMDARMRGKEEVKKISMKYSRLKQLYKRLERANGLLLAQGNEGREPAKSGETSISEIEQKETRLGEVERHLQVIDQQVWSRSLEHFSDVSPISDSSLPEATSILEDVQALTSHIRGSVQYDGIHWFLTYSPDTGYCWLREGEEVNEIANIIRFYQEIEELLEPYLSEFDDVTLAFSKILQEYEQMKRGEAGKEMVSGYMLEDTSLSVPFNASVVIHTEEGPERPPGRLNHYSRSAEDPDSLTDLVLELAKSLPVL